MIEQLGFHFICEIEDYNMNDVMIHETAIVDEGAIIGVGSRIWHWTHVCAGARIGASVSLGQNVFVGNLVTIGDGSKIQNNVSIYDNVHLGNNVFCGPSMVFTNVYNPRAHVERKAEFKDTIIEDGVTFGANCTIICGLRVSQFSFIGAGAVVTKDVDAYALMVGAPARQVGWMSEYGESLDLPLSGDGKAICQQTGDVYILEQGQLRKAAR